LSHVHENSILRDRRNLSRLDPDVAYQEMLSDRAHRVVVLRAVLTFATVFPEDLKTVGCGRLG
jgi:hypothetical protein